MTKIVTLDSNDYQCPFYGILNAKGELWTPLVFVSQEAGEAYLQKVADFWGPKFASIPRTHKVVPVRIKLETVPCDTDGSPQGPDPKGLDGEAATAGAEGIAPTSPPLSSHIIGGKND
jgi:hypothetical protein